MKTSKFENTYCVTYSARVTTAKVDEVMSILSCDPNKSWRCKELAKVTGLTIAKVSDILHHCEDYLERIKVDEGLITFTEKTWVSNSSLVVTDAKGRTFVIENPIREERQRGGHYEEIPKSVHKTHYEWRFKAEG